MHDATMLSRWSAVGPTGARSGQAVVIFAIATAVMIGMIGLAVDVGHAYERRQFLQGAAHNAALAGAFELNSKDASATYVDAAVAQRMIDALKKSGLTVKNPSLQIPTGPGGWTACQASPPLSSTDAYLQAVYIDSNGQQVILNDGSTDYVGLGKVQPGTAVGVQVLRLAICVPHFFMGVLWHGNYDVDVGDNTPGSAVGVSETAPPSPGTIAPFYIYADTISWTGGHKRSLYGVDAPSFAVPANKPNGTAPWQVPCAPKNKNKQSPWQVPLPSCTYSPGDLVTVTDQSPAGGSSGNNWEDVQFHNPIPYSSSTVPTGLGFDPTPLNKHITTFDQSVRGCLDPLSGSVTLGTWYFDRGGHGHCGPTPKLGDTIEAVIVDMVCKNGGKCQDNSTLPQGTTTCQNLLQGGYCVHVVGTVLVYIVTTSGSANGHNGKLVQGYIVGVYQDPDCIVELGSGENQNCTNPITPSALTNWR